jgi:hypothetical protein
MVWTLALSKDVGNKKWRPLHESASFNAGNRRAKKLLAKANWFKRKKDEDDNDSVES